MSSQLSAAPQSWFSALGHILVCFRLSLYPGGQPRLSMRFDSGLQEDLTIEVPNFDTRSYDADHGFRRLHLVFRCPGRASLLAGCDIVRMTPHTFAFESTGEPALQVVWLDTPTAWTNIRKESLHE